MGPTGKCKRDRELWQALEIRHWSSFVFSHKLMEQWEISSLAAAGSTDFPVMHFSFIMHVLVETRK